MIQGLVLTHGAIGAEMVKVVELIMGPVEGLRSDSNQGRSARDTAATVAAWLKDHAPDGGVIFIDDYGGSCASAACLGAEGADNLAVISGVNLAMLLTFVSWREDLDKDELVQRIVDKARQAITVVGAPR